MRGVERADLRLVWDADTGFACGESKPVEGVRLPPLVEVCWLDAHAGTTGWTNVADIARGPCVIYSVGYVLPVGRGGKRGHVTLAQSVEGDDVDHVLHIPDGMVRGKPRVLRRKK